MGLTAEMGFRWFRCLLKCNRIRCGERRGLSANTQGGSWHPEGSFTPAAAKAGLEVGDDAPVMTEAVGPLVTAVVGKTWPPAWTRLQLAGSTDRLWACKKSIPRMAVETSASKIPGEVLTGQL